MKTEDVLNMIDHAVEDFGVSRDAMRWTPEPVEEKGTVLVGPAAARVRMDRLAAYVDQITQVFSVPPEVMERLQPDHPTPMSIGFTPTAAAIREDQNQGFNAVNALLDEVRLPAWYKYSFLNPVISTTPDRWTFRAD